MRLTCAVSKSVSVFKTDWSLNGIELEKLSNRKIAARVCLKEVHVNQICARVCAHVCALHGSVYMRGVLDEA